MRCVLICLALVLALPVLAQERRPSHCIALAGAAPGIAYLQPAAFHAPPAEHTVRIRYIDHSMFLIATHGGLTAITDYNGFLGPAAFTPDIATMNNAHGTHWTARPDSGIAHVLEGWADGAGPRDHRLDLGEMLVRNVHTDVRSGFGGVRRHGNSIFVFEVAGLCIGHLGHLHHFPDDAQLAALGRLDVVMAAVDGGTTLDLPTMIRLLKRLRSSVVIPMHWFSSASLERFLAGMADEFAIRRDAGSAVEVSLATLPDRPTVFALRPAYLQD